MAGKVYEVDGYRIHDTTVGGSRCLIFYNKWGNAVISFWDDKAEIIGAIDASGDAGILTEMCSLIETMKSLHCTHAQISASVVALVQSRAET